MSNKRDKSNKVVNVCHHPNPTQKNQTPSKVLSKKVKTKPSRPRIIRNSVWSAQSLTDPSIPGVAILHPTLWHMFRTAKITRSPSYRKCGTGSSIATRKSRAANRIILKKAIFPHSYKSRRTTQDSMALKIPSLILPPRRTTFKLVSTTRIYAISMKKNFKYFTKSKRSIRKYGQLSPF